MSRYSECFFLACPELSRHFFLTRFVQSNKQESSISSHVRLESGRLILRLKMRAKAMVEHAQILQLLCAG